MKSVCKLPLSAVPVASTSAGPLALASSFRLAVLRTLSHASLELRVGSRFATACQRDLPACEKKSSYYMTREAGVGAGLTGGTLRSRA